MLFTGRILRHYYALLANAGSSNVSVFDLQNPMAPANQPVVSVGTTPLNVAIAPDGRSALVANGDTYNLTPLDLANPLVPVANSPVSLVAGAFPQCVAIAPNGCFALTAPAISPSFIIRRSAIE